MTRTETANNDPLIVSEAVLKGDLQQKTISEETENNYRRAVEQIQKRVDTKSYFYVDLKRFLENKRLISCLSRASHHDIYGKNIRILVELLRFLSLRIDSAPSILNKFAKLKNFYGEKHYKFKNMIDFMEIAENANTIMDLYTDQDSEKETQISFSRAKSEIGGVIDKMSKDVNRRDRKNKRRGKGLEDFDLGAYQEQVLKTLAQYLNVEGLSERELRKLMEDMLKQKNTEFLPEKVISAQVKAGIKGVGDLI